MKKSIFFIAFFIVLISVLISSCATSGVIIADSDTDRNSGCRDSTEITGGSKDTIRAMKFAGINSNLETDCIIIKINGPAVKINQLREAANGNLEIHYYLKGHTPKSK